MSGNSSNSDTVQAYFVQDGIIQQSELHPDGARLIAPSIPCEGNPNYSVGKEDIEKDGFELALDGAYPLSNPVLDLKSRTVYSVDMVRLEFFHDDQQKLINAIDKNTILATMSTYTSNRIGSYRFMWVFDYSDGVDGGYCIHKDDGVIEDGSKGVVIKIGYGVISKGGKSNNKGFVEFNPNKCEVNGRKFLDYLFDVGCMFVLKRFDLAIDYAIDRNLVRVLRDRRTYEYVISSKGGATEYLGTRNSPGRVKVYDKAGEQGLETYLTRVELTVDANWKIEDIKVHLPVCTDYKKVKGDGLMLALTHLIGDVLYKKNDNDNLTFSSVDVVPEKYWSMLPKNTRYKLKKILKNSSKVIEYNDIAIIKCIEIANSYVR